MHEDELPDTLGGLRATGWRSRSVKQELRENLIARRRAGEPVFPGVLGFDQTVVPALENALLAGHDLLLLGLRGQAKSRLLRGLKGLLDPLAPVIEGSEVNDDPLRPISAYGQRRVAEDGDDTPIRWITPEERYREKLATPDVTVADLVGDVDPIKAATRKLTYADPESITFGIVPRTHRGIFAVNELPDLPARIQVAFLDLLEERTLQIRGFPVRLPLDLLCVFSANPEDYTNRGSIITPLKDRIDSQVMTHYPRDVRTSLAITRQEARTERTGLARVELPETIELIVEEAVLAARRSEFVDPASGVSQRAAISAVECVVSNAERRALTTGEEVVEVRVQDVYAATAGLVGKLELVYEGEQQGTEAVAQRVIGEGIRAVFDARFPRVYAGGDERRRDGNADSQPADEVYRPVLQWFAQGGRVDLADDTDAASHRSALEQVDGLLALVREHADPADSTEETVLLELALEGLHQYSLIARDDLDRGTRFGDMLRDMLGEFGG